MINIAILASGTGTNAKKLIEKSFELNNVEIKVLISDKKNAPVLDLAKFHNIPCTVVERKKLTQIEHEIEILKILNLHRVHWIFLAGYMRILSGQFIKRFYDKKNHISKIINIHPSLLPEYKGLNAFERAYQDEVNLSGISVHFVTEDVDAGKIIMQESFPRFKSDSLEEFIQRGKLIEHTLYPKVLERLNENQIFKGIL